MHLRGDSCDSINIKVDLALPVFVLFFGWLLQDIYWHDFAESTGLASTHGSLVPVHGTLG